MDFKPSDGDPADIKGVPDQGNRIDWDAFVKRDPISQINWDAFVKHMLSDCKPFLFIDYDAVSSIPAHLRDAYIKCLTEGRVAGGNNTQ
jgi:hypothetical protein